MHLSLAISRLARQSQYVDDLHRVAATPSVIENDSMFKALCQKNHPIKSEHFCIDIYSQLDLSEIKTSISLPGTCEISFQKVFMPKDTNG